MLPYFTTHFGNPSGTDTLAGRRAAEAVSNARAEVAKLLGAEPIEIVFTSGATEANNLAILGTIQALKERTDRRQIVTTPIEHKAVLEACKAATNQGFEVALLPVNSVGRVDINRAREVISQETLLVSVQIANNEIGTTQASNELASIAHSAGAIFHIDAAQAVGKLPLDVEELGADLLSISGHKFYGPKGVGALYLRNGYRSFPIKPLLYGGGQEGGLRPGTINVPGVVAIGRAAQLARERLREDAHHLTTLRNEFESELLRRFPTARRNGDLKNRLPNNSSITFPGIDAQALIANVPELELSTGSACTAGAIEPSYVLEAIGLSRSEAYSTIRFGFGRPNTLAEAHLAAEILSEAARTLEGM